MTRTEPGGTWPSPITVQSLVEGAVHASDLRVSDGALHWLESRPAEGGRVAAMTMDGGGARELTAAPFNVRTRVHEYGGAPYLVAGGALYFANFKDQRLYRQADGAAPVALTGEGYRYADGVAAPDGGLVAVREDHADPADVRNTLVRLSGQPGDSGEVLYAGADFVAYPRLSPDGQRLAWIAWDHPHMPWDATRLHVADLTAQGLANIEQVAGGDAESVLEPQWSAAGDLYFISDRSGFWNLYRRRDGQTQALAPMAAEFAGPLWTLGQANYALMPGARLVARYSRDGREQLAVIAPDTGEITEIAWPFAESGSLQALDDHRVALIAAAADQTAAIVTVDIDTHAIEIARRPSPARIAARHIARAEPIHFPSANGRTAHALYYPPTNGDVALPPGAAPPLIVQAHGGPTSRASAAFSLANQFWTSRGFALVDVDYGGSSGYGRAYRQALNGQWGVVDVEDVIAAARFLIQTGRADPRRIAIHGGSAGGFTVLAALAQSDVFGAGADFYGVSDLTALAQDTHKFESRYLDGLVGPYPAAQALYEVRSPINQLDRFATPLIILQGADDPVVPPNQARMILAALRARRLPVAYLEFPGESHGFRRAETIIAAKQAELYFYGQVLGFEPADDLPAVEIENLAAAAGRGER
jgi:dipeptidyl aminopeptidase/acylaminoacyl peptidase